MRTPRDDASLAAVVRCLGGELYGGGRRALAPGPGHSPADRSLSLLLVGRKVVAHSFAGDDWRAVLADLRERGLLDRRGRLTGAGMVADARPPAPSRPEKLACARTLWDTARPAPCTLAEAHVRRRGIGRELPGALRFHPGVPAAVYAGLGSRRPAQLAAVRDPSGALCAVELTYLAPGGGVAPVRAPRKTIGSLPRGCAVRLDAEAEVLLVGEGVFSCLSASQALGLPAWALLSVGNLRAWTPPAGVRRVVIAADRGAPGEAGAAALAGRLRGMGVAVAVRLPPSPWPDWNDAVRAAGGGGGAGEGGPSRGIGRRPAEEPSR